MMQFLRKLFRKNNQENYPITPLDIDLKHEKDESKAYSIELYNDDKTNMEYVVNILKVCFGLKEDKAIEVMLKIHQEGSAKILKLEKESADKLVKHTNIESQRWGFPFKLSVVNA